MKALMLFLAVNHDFLYPGRVIVWLIGHAIHDPKMQAVDHAMFGSTEDLIIWVLIPMTLLLIAKHLPTLFFLFGRALRLSR